MQVSLQFDEFFQKQKFRRIWDFLKKLKSLRPKLVGTSRTSRSRLWIKVKWCGSNILREQPAFLIANQTGRENLRHLLKERKKKTNHRKEILHCHFKGPSFTLLLSNITRRVGENKEKWRRSAHFKSRRRSDYSRVVSLRRGLLKTSSQCRPFAPFVQSTIDIR